MSLKSFIVLMTLLAVLGLLFLEYVPDHLYILGVLAVIGAAYFEYIWGARRRHQNREPLQTSNQEDIDDGEYHNDFSKVPAGTADAIPPKPRNYLPINIYQEFNDTLNEDLRNMGLEDVDDNANDKDKTK
jgi:hypothetical protein